MKEYGSENVGVRFIEPTKELGRIPVCPAYRQAGVGQESDPYKNQGEASKKSIIILKTVGHDKLVKIFLTLPVYMKDIL
ncbi:hypothetical protein KAX02_12835 [candidate division WOR-3 bacterium]|nr:hypothetical protein [candidate division WOR-3 bacterium]